MSRYVVAIDQGTTGSTVLVFDEKLALRGRGYREFQQHYPEPGWVEHEPEEIWQSVLGALADAESEPPVGNLNSRAFLHAERRDGHRL